MKFSGQIIKMATHASTVVQYYLNLSSDLIHINELIGKEFSISLIGYQCVSCGSDEKLFRMGFCKKCFFESPYASETIIRPELSRAHLGEEERDLEIEKQIQLVPHIVYLSHTGDLKVGVTREHQIPTRWIDQGANSALVIAKTENRYEAGMIEVALKKKLSDKTNYKKMLLTSEGEFATDLLNERDLLREFVPEEYQQFLLSDQQVVTIAYPYTPPIKVVPFTLEKVPNFKGTLQGIKGQYLSFGDSFVFNVRNHEGYVVDLEVC